MNALADNLYKMEQSHLLISFCNQASSPDCSLCLFDLNTSTSRWVDFNGLSDQYRNGFTGLCGIVCFADTVIIATQGANPVLAVIDVENATIANYVALQRCKDPHSLVYSHGVIYVVSTGTNEIYKVPFSQGQFGEEDLFWCFPGVSSERDEVHLNGLTIDGDHFIASCFGPRVQDGSWGRDGMIFYIESGKTIQDGLDQPHSPIVLGERLAFAESAAHKVCIFDKTNHDSWIQVKRFSLPGYTRGLLLSDERLLVGVSSSRSLSRSKGKFLNNKKQYSQDSSLHSINLGNGQVNASWNLRSFGREPYDLCPVLKSNELCSEVESIQVRIRNMESWADRTGADMGILHEQLLGYRRADKGMVSVILPTYNRAEFLIDSIQSVLTQTYSNLELIVVDDGSTDDTEESIKSITDARMHYIRQPNRGRSNARNHALSLARGKYIAFLDSDDLYLPHKIQSQVDYLSNHPGTGMVYTAANCIDEKGDLLKHVYKAPVSGLIYENIAFFTPVTITLPTVMTYREIIDAVGGFDERMHRFEDTDIWRRISKYCRVDAMQDVTCLLRTHDDNSLINQNPDDIVNALAYYADKILDDDGEVNIRVRMNGLANMYRYYAHAFMSVSEFSARGRELLLISTAYGSILGKFFPPRSIVGRPFWYLYSSLRLDICSYWVGRLGRRLYSHSANYAYQGYSRVRSIIFKR